MSKFALGGRYSEAYPSTWAAVTSVSAGQTPKDRRPGGGDRAALPNPGRRRRKGVDREAKGGKDGGVAGRTVRRGKRRRAHGSGEVPTDPARSRSGSLHRDLLARLKGLSPSAGEAAPATSPRRSLRPPGRDRNVDFLPEGAPLAGGAGLLQLLPGPGQRPPRLQQQPEPPLPAARATSVREPRGRVRHAAGLLGAGGARPPLPPQPRDLQPEHRPDAALHPALLPQRVRGQRGRHRQQDRAGHGSGQESPDVRGAGGGGGTQGADQGAGGEELPPGAGEQLAEEPGQSRAAAEVPLPSAPGGSSGPREEEPRGSCPSPTQGGLCGVRWLCPWGGQSHGTVST